MSIRKMYESKQITAKRNNTFLVAFEDLHMEPGYNIRDGEVDPESVDGFCASFMAGDYVPAIGVDITENGLRVNDGQHRYLGAQKAVSQGKTGLMLEVYDVTELPKAKRIARMVSANDGTPTSPIARANAYSRMKAEGMTNDQIAKEVKRSPSDVANFLALAACPDHLKEMVKAGNLSYVMAIELAKEHGENAPAVAEEALAAAKAAGKDKVTKKFTPPKEPKEPREPAPELEEQPQAPKAPKAKPAPLQGAFGKDKLGRIADLAVHVEMVAGQDLKKASDDQSLTMRCPAGVWRELSVLLDEYLGAQ